MDTFTWTKLQPNAKWVKYTFMACVRGVILLKCDKLYNRTAYQLTSLLSLTFLADLISGSFSLKLPTLNLLYLPCYSRAVAAIYSYPLKKSEYGQREGQIIAALAKGKKDSSSSKLILTSSIG